MMNKKIQTMLQDCYTDKGRIYAKIKNKKEAITQNILNKNRRNFSRRVFSNCSRRTYILTYKICQKLGNDT